MLYKNYNNNSNKVNQEKTIKMSFYSKFKNKMILQVNFNKKY